MPNTELVWCRKRKRISDSGPWPRFRCQIGAYRAMVQPTPPSRSFCDPDHEQPRSLILSIGEVMIEMTRGSDGRFRSDLRRRHFQYGGLSRSPRAAGRFRKRTRRRSLFRQILTLAASEGIATELVSRVPGRLPGLCLVETIPAGDPSRISGVKALRPASCSNCQTGDASPKP